PLPFGKRPAARILEPERLVSNGKQVRLLKLGQIPPFGGMTLRGCLTSNRHPREGGDLSTDPGAPPLPFGKRPAGRILEPERLVSNGKRVRLLRLGQVPPFGGMTLRECLGARGGGSGSIYATF
ncbi:MAG: hypothetical protein KJ622_08770, partial [Alphaproteobacteria bacterium]|nr:hypothetical protein [Alphaproteobacteria bacterium]